MDGPPRHVREAFGARGDAWPLSGGQGTAWAVGDLILKPDADLRQQEWHGTMLIPLRRCGFRLADAVATRDGRWLCDGWSATRAVEREEPSHQASPRWAEIIEAGRALHRATASLPRPDFIGTRDTWWETADRQTWATTSPNVLPLLQPVLERLKPGFLGGWRRPGAPKGSAEVPAVRLCSCGGIGQLPGGSRGPGGGGRQPSVGASTAQRFGIGGESPREPRLSWFSARASASHRITARRRPVPCP